MAEAAVDLTFFTKLGFDDKTKKQIAKNNDLAVKIKNIYESKNITEASEPKSALVYSICTSTCPQLADQADFLADLVFNGKLTSKQQIKLAESYFAAHLYDFDQAEFDKHCGIGVVLTDKDILDYVTKFVADNHEKLAKVEYRANHPDFLGPLKDGLPLANPSDILKIATEHIKEKFANELKELSDPAKKKEKKKEEVKEKDHQEGEHAEEFQKIDISKLVARDLAESINDAELLRKHKEKFGDKIITRFPPEPNGILHIGHCRAIRFNFSIAGLYKGDCNLRYDDTNPEKEKREYMDMIEANVKWMGFTPTEILHASHYFPQIFDWTLELIKKGKAYVCKLPVETLRKYKEEMIPSPYRDTSPEENLKEFELMKCGYYAEGEAVLRAKIDYKSPNTTMRDPVLYRVLYTPHPVTGNRWCIYPLYDYTHPLSDSIEGITHSCCTLEFETRRDLYYWPLKELNLYKPFVWEFSRLNLTYALTSKRKILQLIEDK
jgi:glutaminyl-tRNA synthetase